MCKVHELKDNSKFDFFTQRKNQNTTIVQFVLATVKHLVKKLDIKFINIGALLIIDSAIYNIFVPLIREMTKTPLFHIIYI